MPSHRFMYCAVRRRLAVEIIWFTLGAEDVADRSPLASTSTKSLPVDRRASNQLRDAPNRSFVRASLSGLMALYKRVLCGRGQIEHPLEHCNYCEWK